MPTFLGNVLRNTPLRSPQLINLQKHLAVVYSSRYTIVFLFILGLIRAVVFLLAYPPAHGPDHLAYYLHAAVLSGVNLPVTLANTVPLYPVLFAVLNYGLGNFHLIFGVQLAMSAVEGTLYYVGLRRYSPALAFISALVITGDPQTGILYNFTSTEPLYLFLLAVTVCLMLIQCRRSFTRRTLVGDAALGMIFFGLTITRTVARFLYLPLGILFLVGTRDWRRGLVLAASFVITSQLFNTLYDARINSLASLATDTSTQRLTNVNDTMVLAPLTRNHLLRAENGPASTELIEASAACPNQDLVCFYNRVGGQVGYLRLLNRAYLEMVRARPLDYARAILNEFGNFLSMSGQQYRGTPSPIEAQCSNVENVVEESTNYYINSWILSGTENLNRNVLEATIGGLEGRVCPPMFHQPTVQAFVDALAFRYRSLGRPQPYLWYGALIVLVGMIPWARRFWLPMMTAGVILVNHAAISALLANVQPRYVVVTNPSRVMLLLMLLYIVTVFVVRVIDERMVTR